MPKANHRFCKVALEQLPARQSKDPEQNKACDNPRASHGCFPRSVPDASQSEKILDDGDLVVTVYEVNHEPVRPAVGFRFDYKGRSIFISGDTKKSSNVTAGARNADVLVHEAQSQRMRQIYVDAATAAGNKVIAKIFTDIEDYHSSPVDAAEIANDAKVKLLVYTHFIPQFAAWFMAPLFFEGVSDVRPSSAWVAGFDGYRVDLPIRSDAVIQGKVQVGLF